LGLLVEAAAATDIVGILHSFVEAAESLDEEHSLTGLKEGRILHLLLQELGQPLPESSSWIAKTLFDSLSVIQQRLDPEGLRCTLETVTSIATEYRTSYL
jgi:hypothetical protein